MNICIMLVKCSVSQSGGASAYIHDETPPIRPDLPAEPFQLVYELSDESMNWSREALSKN